MRILIIEDEILIQKSLVHVLTRNGNSVDATASGIEAISRILNDDYDRVVCDLMLKDMIRQWVYQKEAGHLINSPQFQRPNRSMSQIGG